MQNVYIGEPGHEAHDHLSGTIDQPAGDIDQIFAYSRCAGVLPLRRKDIFPEDQRQIVGEDAMPEIATF